MNTTEVLHKAVQYLAAANLTYVPSQEDDSHSNLGWNKDSLSFETHALNDTGLKLTLSLEYYSLDFTTPKEGVVASYPLKRAIHLDILNWLTRECEYMGLKGQYAYQFHYELPYEEISDTFRFPELTREQLQAHSELRNLANELLGSLSQDFNRYNQPRIWPHHFDTGSLAWLENGSIGYGLAIPDSMINEFYFYAAGYKGHNSINVDDFEPLSKGDWKSGEWNGAVIPSSEGKDQIDSFLKEVSTAFRSLV